MLRRCGPALCKTPPPAHVEKTANIFALRRAPTSLHTANMHSTTLSDHPATSKMLKTEMNYKQRQLSERGEYERAVAAEAEAAQHEKNANAESTEYRNVIFFMTLGYFTAHSVVYKYYYPEDVRFSYEPDRGYADDVEKRREVLQTVDELVGFSVLESVFSKPKSKYKESLLQPSSLTQ